MSEAPEPKPCPFCENAMFILRHPFNGHDYVHHHSERSDRLGTNCPLSRTPVRLDVWNSRADLSVAEAARVLLDDPEARRFMHRPGYAPSIHDWLNALAKEPSHD